MPYSPIVLLTNFVACNLHEQFPEVWGLQKQYNKDVDKHAAHSEEPVQVCIQWECETDEQDGQSEELIVKLTVGHYGHNREEE